MNENTSVKNKKQMRKSQYNQNYTKKLKATEKYDDYKRRKTDYMRKYRENKKNIEKKMLFADLKKVVKDRREAVHERVKKYRERKSQEISKSSKLGFVGYNCIQTLGKAVKKAKLAIPASPTKKRAVLANIVSKMDDKEKQEFINVIKSTPVKRKCIPNWILIKAIYTFLERDDISRVSPKIRDVREYVCPETGQTKLLSTRHMLLTIKEAFALFDEEQKSKGESSCGINYFYQHRPAHIKMIRDLPHNVCMCSYHSNFIEAVSSLHKAVDSLPNYDNGFVKLFICKESKMDCWFGRCDKCPGISIFKLNELVGDISLDSKISWMVWKKVGVNRIEKVKENGSLANLIDHTCALSAKFLKHSFIKREQSEMFNMHDRPRAKNVQFPDEGLLQVDFAENFICEGQDEQKTLNPTSISSRNYLFAAIKGISNCENWDDEYLKKVEDVILSFAIILKKRWDRCHRTISIFMESEEEWLMNKFEFPDKIKKSHNIGRPHKSFGESSDRSQREKTKIVANSLCSPQIRRLAQSTLQYKGKRIAAKMVGEIFDTPEQAQTIKKALFKLETKKPIAMTSDEALAHMLDNDLTKQQYLNVRLTTKQRNADIFPPYDQVLEAKKRCYPESIEITETSCRVPLQSLLTHTINRILDIYSIGKIVGSKNYEMIYKWGCDGSSGHARYKQRYMSPDAESDANLFLISLVPLQLRHKNGDGSTVIIWQNSRPSSTRFCRPLKFAFAKETKELTREEVNSIDEEIDNLKPTIVIRNNSTLTINHCLIFSMIDGKVCNSVTNTSSQKCYIWGCCPKEMNILEKWDAVTVEPELLRFGLSTLHAWIRFFECLLHIAYRLHFKKWQIKIQDKLRSELGLLVDVVLQGHGTTNDGNTARRFFSNAVKSAEITGIDVNLIIRFDIILKTIASGYDINVDAFRSYTRDTASLYVSLYPWYYMPASVHKILMHGADVIKFSILPIGLLSEEAQEARNKDYKKYREHHSRKSSRLNTNTDLFHRLLETSDPYLSSIRIEPRKKKTQICDTVKSLVILNENDNRSVKSEDSNESD
ncbi:unnamed protein product [Brassicogethes aeneus]|uniref:V(D)J recombination-activating protein 1 RNase H domain-containing protein n=1 Tax=Brassicogethes aeneus TaxID=1431903 RepID=A0A9P0BHT9_BRAAE|nr:unnamed protein product [Brassicogethes aeneus]